MLSARRGRQSAAAVACCSSCRLQLLSLFENSFITHPTTPSAAVTAARSRQLPPRPRHLHLQARPGAIHRPSRSWSQNFSDSRKRFMEEGTVEEGGIEKRQKGTGQSLESIEDVARHAKQTFGDTLPKDFLTAEEYHLYERLYGPPIRETRGDDFEVIDKGDSDVVGNNGVAGKSSQDMGRNVLLKENADGAFEEVDFDPAFEDAGGWSYLEAEASTLGEGEESNLEALEAMKAMKSVEGVDLVEQSQQNVVEIPVRSQREIDAIKRLQQDMDTAAARPAEEEEEIDEEVEEEEEELEENEEEEFDEEDDAYPRSGSARTHPHTLAGRFGTSPSTLQLPQEQLVIPITEMLERASIKHVKDAAERAFGGQGLPHSTSVSSAKSLLPQKHIGLEAGQHKMSEIEADAYVAAIMPGVYAAVMSTLVEVRKRLGRLWIQDLFSRPGGPRILDAGGSGAAVLAWRDVLAAEWDGLREDGLVPEKSTVSNGKSTVLTGATTLRHRVSQLLDNTTFLPRLPDYMHSAHPETLLDGAPAEGRKTFDLIIAPHTLFPLKEDYRRKHQVHNLWEMLDPNGGVLILLEKGLPRGFEAIAGARNLLLKKHISSLGSTHYETTLDSPSSDSLVAKETGMIIAPCTNHSQCPMYKIEGYTSGRKDFCGFGQRYERPQFLQKLLGAKVKNHEDVKFSYVAVRRGVDLRESQPRRGAQSTASVLQDEMATEAAFAGYEDLVEDLNTEVTPETPAQQTSPPPSFSPFSLPRAILPPLKRRGHVTLDLCTPSGKLERWTVPRSFSLQAYRDARKSRHGDLWALGAKTRTVREVRLGKRKGEGKDWKGKKDRKGRKGGKSVYEVEVGEEGMEGIREVGDRIGDGEGGSSRRLVDRSEKRTKGGRVARKGKKRGGVEEEWERMQRGGRGGDEEEDDESGH